MKNKKMNLLLCVLFTAGSICAMEQDDAAEKAFKINAALALKSNETKIDRDANSILGSHLTSGGTYKSYDQIDTTPQGQHGWESLEDRQARLAIDGRTALQATKNKTIVLGGLMSDGTGQSPLSHIPAIGKFFAPMK